MTHRTILLNNFSNVAKLSSYLVVSFFMTPFLVHTLGVTLYGIWAMVLSVVGYMTLMDLGMQTAVMKYVAECDGKEDKQTLSQVIVSSLVFYSFVALAGGFILAILVWGGLPLLKINPDHFSTVRWILLIMGIDMLLVFPGTVFQGALTGMQLFYITNSISIVIIFIKAITIYMALSMGKGLVAMALVTLFGNLAEYCTFFALVRWRYRLISFRGKNISIEKLKQMISFGMKSFLIMISGRITLSSDALIVGYFMSAAWVPFYTIPASLINYSRNLLWALTQSFLPLFSNLEAKNDLKQMQSIYLRYTRYTCLCFFPIITLLIVYGEPFLRIWMGPEFALKGKGVIVLLSLALSISGIQPLSGRLLTGTSRQGILIWTGFATSGIFLVLGMILIRSQSLTGLAIAFLIATLIPSFFVLKRSLSVVGTSLNTYFKESVGPPLICATVLGICLQLIKIIYYPSGYGELFLQTGVGILVFSLFNYWISLTSEERALIRGAGISLRRALISGILK